MSINSEKFVFCLNWLNIFTVYNCKIDIMFNKSKIIEIMSLWSSRNNFDYLEHQRVIIKIISFWMRPNRNNFDYMEHGEGNNQNYIPLVVTYKNRKD